MNEKTSKYFATKKKIEKRINTEIYQKRNRIKVIANNQQRLMRKFNKN